MLVLILSSIEDEIVNAYNSYKLVKSEIIEIQYNRFYRDIHRGYKIFPKHVIQGSGSVVYDLVAKLDHYDINDTKRGNIQAVVNYNEESKTANYKIIYNGKSEEGSMPFMYISPYITLKQLIMSDIERTISIEGSKIKLEFRINDRETIRFILNKDDYTIRYVAHLKDGLFKVKIRFDNTQVIQ